MESKELRTKLAEVRKKLAETKADRDDIFHQLDMTQQVVKLQDKELNEMRAANRKLAAEAKSSPQTNLIKPPCPACGGKKVHSKGLKYKKRRWNCLSCNHYWSTPTEPAS
ncbi:hypothetical protein [Coleofasciculus sp. FACHB-SPT9]|uniref:hypothetical protein n=1 Tax=Cyanophyceae TaxID=3028117 RepID=UPI00168754D7|nr:hypothetical protein [Coleofasciculus sp. FACHB-SPT9]MBD1889320.1 hypothetical protein [Coleofasciculus sp. FACHB-SPT9]